MKRLLSSLKILCLGALFISPFSVYAKEASVLKASFDENMNWSMYLLLRITGSDAQSENEKINEEILIESFSEFGPGGLPEYPKLMNNLYSHMFYTQDLEARNNPFVRRLFAHYTPGSANYEKLTQLQVDFLKHLEIMEDIYQRPIDGSEDEQYPSIAELEALYKAQQDAEEGLSS